VPWLTHLIVLSPNARAALRVARGMVGRRTAHKVAIVFAVVCAYVAVRGAVRARGVDVSKRAAPKLLPTSADDVEASRARVRAVRAPSVRFMSSEDVRSGVSREQKGGDGGASDVVMDDDAGAGGSATPTPTASRPTGEPVFMTFSDRVTDGACLGLETAAMAGMELKLIGVDGGVDGQFDYSYVKNVKTKKLFGWIKVLTELGDEYGIRDDTLVVLADATDVLYLQSADVVLSKYLALMDAIQPTRDLVIVSAERNCWPYMDGQRELQPGGREHCAKFPDGNGSSYKYLNSGSCCGPARALAQMLTDIKNKMETVNDDDQHCLQEAYMREIEGHGSDKYTIALDHKQQLFQTGWGSRLETSAYALYDAKGAYYNTTRGVIVNTEHNVEPAMVHFNGAKPAHVPIAKHYVSFHAKKDNKSAEAHERLNLKYPWFADKCSSVLNMNNVAAAAAAT
jgi:hypothetical protein